MAAPVPVAAIDLTMSDDDSIHRRGPDSCGNPHHAQILRSLRRQLHNCQQALEQATANHAQEIRAKEDIIAERQGRIVDLVARNTGQADEMRRLQAGIDALRDRLNGRGKRQKRTWPEKLQAFINGSRQLSYNSIFSLSCKEENMSARTEFVHPQIRLGMTANGWRPESPNAGPAGRNGRTFWFFRNLPPGVQARIFELCLKKERPIHCFSRLDPVRAPAVWPLSKSDSGLRNRFYWGPERVLSLTVDTADPQGVLALLLVSKDFYFMGVHAFYSLNTFAFSSIGEFGRFCKGIGKERAARLQHLELVWTGSQYLTAEHTFSGTPGRQVEHWDSVRTRPLAHLVQLSCLRTLHIFLSESDTSYERRQYEDLDTKAVLLEQTAKQPNCRKNRSLRTLQGIDYVYALRGLDRVHLYDLWAMQRDVSPSPARRPIRDTTFIADVNSTVTMPKSADKARESELRNLPPLFPPLGGAAPGQAPPANPANTLKPWDPSRADWSTVQKLSHTAEQSRSGSYSRTRTYYGVRDLDAGPNENRANAAAAPANAFNNANAGPAPERSVLSVGANALGLGPQNRAPHGSNGQVRPIPGMGGDGSHRYSRPSDLPNRNGPGSRQQERPHSTMGPAPAQPPDSLRRPLLGPAHRPAPQRLPAAAASGAAAGPSRPPPQKRPSNDNDKRSAKRQRQAGIEGKTAGRMQIHVVLGTFFSCASIARLLNPIAPQLLYHDWVYVKNLLVRPEDARDDPAIFRRYIEADGQDVGHGQTVLRITEALGGQT